MLEEIQRCFAAAAVLAVAGLWLLAGGVTAVVAALAASAAYAGVAYVQRRPQKDDVVRRLRRRAETVLARERRQSRRPQGRSRPRSLPAQEELPSSTGRGYGW